MNKHEINYYHDIKGYNYLKPTRALINRAQKELMKEYKKFVKNKEKGTRQLYYRHSTIRNKRVILYEFVLHMENNRTYKPETSKFEFVASFDFYMQKGLMTEKKVYYTIAGWAYKPYYHYMVYPFKWEGSKGGFFSRPRVSSKTHSFKNIKISKHFSTRVISKSYSPYDVQKIILKDPKEVEMLYKLGFTWLLPIKNSKKRLNFIKKHSKDLPKRIMSKEINTIIKTKTIFKNKTIKEVLEFNKLLERSRINIYKLNKESAKRIDNLIKAGHNVKDFIIACLELDLDYNIEVMKQKKIRDAIINEFEAIKRQKDWKRRREIIRKNEEKLKNVEKEDVKTLEQVTKNFNHVKVDEFVFKPLKTIKDFADVSNELEICLMQNEYYNKVKEGVSMIYTAIPKGKKIKDGEVFELYVYPDERIALGQLVGFRNKPTENHEKIKNIVKTFKYENLVGEANV